MPYVRKPSPDTSKLVRLVQAQAAAERAVTAEVARLRHLGATWLDVAEVLGRQRQNAQRRFQNLEQQRYSAWGQRISFGWVITVSGVPAAVFHCLHEEPPSEEWVRAELAAVLDRDADAFRLQLFLVDPGAAG